MGKSINPMEMDSAPAPDEAGAWDILRAQGRTYYELELLVNAIRALSEWSEQEAEYTQKHPKLSGASPALKQAKAAVDDAMQPVLKGCILLNPLNEDEAADLEQIRRRYIPELVLGYNAVLHASGYLISRENLLDSMEMSVTIADDTYHLVEPFRAAGRMGELVRSFAHTSKSMLVLKAEGRKWTTKKSRTGRDLGVWEIGSQSAGGGHARELSLS
jgi:nuclear pore complex protein Nup107